jgi:hypothetical protein
MPSFPRIHIFLSLVIGTLLAGSLFSASKKDLLFTAKELRFDDFFAKPHEKPKTGKVAGNSFAEYRVGKLTVRFTESKFSGKGEWMGYGVDGGSPQRILSSLKISGPSGNYALPNKMVTDLGNPSIEHYGTRMEGKQLELAMCNSDGAGGHFVLYQIDLAKAKARRYVREVIDDEFTRTHDWTQIKKVQKSKPGKGVGTYELIQKFEDQATGDILTKNTLKMVLREDGVAEAWQDDKREEDGQWDNRDGEIRVTDPDGEIICFKKKPNGDLRMFRLKNKNGEIQTLPKDKTIIWKKTK